MKLLRITAHGLPLFRDDPDICLCMILGTSQQGNCQNSHPFFHGQSFYQKGCTVVFTTHDLQLLDVYDRNDGICIVRNRYGITIENLSSILKRNDIRNSDAYQSSFLKGTESSYQAYISLKQSLASDIH